MEVSQIDALILAAGGLLAGLYLLIKSGNWIVESAVYIAHKFHVAPIIIGFTIVAFGTSLPELVVSILANLQGTVGIALGNVMGSNIANIGLVLGFTAILYTLKTTVKSVARDLGLMMVATVLLTVLMQYGEISRLAGFGMLILLITYVFYGYMRASDDDVPEEAKPEKEYNHPLAPYGYLLAGMVLIYFGAELLVRCAKISAAIIGVPDAVIGLSVIALGTSLPELSTCLIAARKGHHGIVIGNIIGSNVFNILMIIGVASLVKPIMAGDFDAYLANIDIWIVLGISSVLAAVLLLYRKITPFLGMLFLAFYAFYNVYIYYRYLSEL